MKLIEAFESLGSRGVDIIIKPMRSCNFDETYNESNLFTISYKFVHDNGNMYGDYALNVAENDIPEVIRLELSQLIAMIEKIDKSEEDSEWTSTSLEGDDY